MDNFLAFLDRAGYCHHCKIYADHTWGGIVQVYQRGHSGHTYLRGLEEVYVSFCAHCSDYCIWREGVLIFPDTLAVQFPNSDLPPEIKADYLEAASVLSKSHKASAALLRLCLQKLCKHLGEKGDNINDDIKSLVAKGLPVGIQRAMDTIRVVGNNAVHPGEINPDENKDNAIKLFGLINVITHAMITQPKEIEALYGSLPAGAKEAIERRDQPKP